MAQSRCITPNHEVKVLHKLGEGQTGSVYAVRVDSVEYALKVFTDPRTFWREYYAYRKCAKIKSLKGRISSFKGALRELPPALARKDYGFYHRALVLDILAGQPLHKVIDSIPPHQLWPLREELVHTMRILQDEAGVCHGDPEAWNIMVMLAGGGDDESGINQVVCFDFSHAFLKEKVTERAWKIRTDRDVVTVKSIFSEYNERRARNLAIDLATPAIINDPCRQLKLARLVTKAVPSSDLFEALELVQPPIPALAVSTARAMARAGQSKCALIMLEAYSPPKSYDTHEWSKRDLLDLEFERARLRASISHSEVDIKLMAPIAAKFAETLGSLDRDTLCMTLTYARHLQENRQEGDAASVYLKMLENLHDWRENKPADKCHITEKTKRVDVTAWVKRVVQCVRDILGDIADQQIQSQISITLQKIGYYSTTQDPFQISSPTRGVKRKCISVSEGQTCDKPSDGWKKAKHDGEGLQGVGIGSDKENQG